MQPRAAPPACRVPLPLPLLLPMLSPLPLLQLLTPMRQ
jgi:hypothetical protein